MKSYTVTVGCTLLMLLGLCGQNVDAYQQISVDTGTRRVFFHWSQATARYFVNDRAIAGVTSSQFQAALARAFRTWEEVSTSSITFQLAGVTDATPGDRDGLNTFGFLNRPDMEGILAITLSIADEVTGEILESDVVFNSAHPWSTANDGEADRFDLESTALHEIGHFLGLDHSALGEMETMDLDARVAASETIMFPIAFDPGTIAERRLRADDIAGASAIYPADGFHDRTATINGRVLKDGRGVVGAHIIAFNTFSGTMIGGLSIDSSGEFSISGVDAGLIVLRVEPIDDGDVSSYLAEPPFVDLDFKTRFFDRLVPVERGSRTQRFDIVVEPK